MKKENLLSKAEMKKITGGDPPKIWTCHNTYNDVISCHVTQSECIFYCDGVLHGCHEEYGYCG